MQTVIFCILCALIFYIFIYLPARKRITGSKKNWVSATGKLLSIEKTIFKVGTGLFPDTIMKLKVLISENNVLTIRHAFSKNTELPNPGDELQLLIDPKNPKKAVLAVG